MSLALQHLVKLISGNALPSLAANLARELDLALVTAEVGAFADGEIRVHVTQDVRDATVFIVQPTCPPVNDHLMVLALLADAVRAAGAARIIGIVPYFGYARQEQRGRSGDPRSAQLACRLLGSVGLDHLVTLDLHAPALESALPMPATLLHAEEMFLPRIKSWAIRDLVVVAPDAGRPETGAALRPGDGRAPSGRRQGAAPTRRGNAPAGPGQSHGPRLPDRR